MKNEDENSRERASSVGFGLRRAERNASRSQDRCARDRNRSTSPQQRNPTQRSEWAWRIRDETPTSAAVDARKKDRSQLRRTVARRADSGDESNAAFRSTGTQDLTSIPGRGSGPKTVDASPFESAGLKGTLHVSMLLKSGVADRPRGGKKTEEDRQFFVESQRQPNLSKARSVVDKCRRGR